VRQHDRRVLGIFVSIVAILAGITVLPAAAGAHGAPAAAGSVGTAVSNAPVVDIAVTSDGVSAPIRHSSGVISFRVTTTVIGHGRGSSIELVRLRPGTSPETFATHLAQIFSPDRASAMAAARAMMAEAELFGGAQVQPDQPGTFTTGLLPGTYYVFDLVAFEFQPPAGPEALHQLTITEDRHGGFPPVPQATVWSLSTPNGPVFLAPSRISASQPILFTNLIDQVNAAVFMPVHGDTTDDDLQAFFAALEGGPPAPSPFIGGPVGSTPLSPGRSIVLQLQLPPGRYALVTWVNDVDDDILLASKGMHQIVTVT
jgi:hypothetical protein